MFVVDTDRKRVVKDNEIKAYVSRWKPYRRWLENNKIELKGLLQVPGQVTSENERLPLLKSAFGYTQEDIDIILLPMVMNAQEPIGSMGNDAKLAALSDQPQTPLQLLPATFCPGHQPTHRSVPRKSGHVFIQLDWPAAQYYGRITYSLPSTQTFSTDSHK